MKITARDSIIERIGPPGVTQAGYMMVSLIVSIAVMGVLIVAGSVGLTQYERSERARAQGRDLERLAEVVERYITAYASEIGSGQAINAVDERTGKTIRIEDPAQPKPSDVFALMRAGTFENEVRWPAGARYQVRLTRGDGTRRCDGGQQLRNAASCRVTGVIYIDKPLLDKDQIDTRSLRVAVQEVGRHGGYSKPATPDRFSFPAGEALKGYAGADIPLPNPLGIAGVLARRVDALYSQPKLTHQRDGSGRADSADRNAYSIATMSLAPVSPAEPAPVATFRNDNQFINVRRERVNDNQNSFFGDLQMGYHRLTLHAFTQAGMGQFGRGMTELPSTLKVGGRSRSVGLDSSVTTSAGVQPLKTDMRVVEEDPRVTRQVKVDDTLYAPRLVFGQKGRETSFPSPTQEERPGLACDLSAPGLTFYKNERNDMALLACVPDDRFARIDAQGGDERAFSSRARQQGVWQLASMSDTIVRQIKLPDQAGKGAQPDGLNVLSLSGWRVCLSNDARVKTIRKSARNGSFEIVYDRDEDWRDPPEVICYGGRGRI